MRTSENIRHRVIGGGTLRSIIQAILAACAALLLFAALPAFAHAAEVSKQGDTSTLGKWEEHAVNSTRDIGRIWTDKSVFIEDADVPMVDVNGEAVDPAKVEIGKSQFLVGLSALSSKSNTTEVSSKPLDIVLVLDMSYSMDPNRLASGAVAVYDIDEKNVYYINSGSTYTEVHFDAERNQWGYFTGGNKWQSVVPKASPNSSGRQFYTAPLSALKNAVNDFAGFDS